MATQSSYGTSNPNAGRPANGDREAWGGYAWPIGVPAKLLGTTDYRSSFGQNLAVRMRTELVPLWQVLFAIADAYDYPIWSVNNGENWGPWGYENRPVSGTSRPSGHSMALSVDINAPYNPYSYMFRSDMPVGMVEAFEACGMYWGGRYVGQRFDCFTGDTRLITRDGPVAIEDLSGREVELLTTTTDPTGDHPSAVRTEWVKAPVRDYGYRQVRSVLIERGGVTSTVRATGEHRWPVVIGGRVLRYRTTDELRPGMRLPALEYPVPDSVVLDDYSIARGVVWGDGSVYNRHRPHPQARVQLCGPKAPDLRAYIEPYARYWRDDTAWGLPPELKSLPSEHADLPIAAGFFAGWFATDGCGDDDAGFTLSSSDVEAVAWLQAVAPRLGLTITGIGVQPAGDSGFGSTRDNHQVRFRDVPDYLLLRDRHRATRRRERTMVGWKVVSVTDSVVARTYCPTIEGRNVVAVDTPTVPVLSGQCMHFGYCFPPGRVAGHLSLAKDLLRELGGRPAPAPSPEPNDPITLEEMDMYLAVTRDTKNREVWATVDASGVRYINNAAHLADLKKAFPTVRVDRAWYNANRAPNTGAVK